MGLAYWWLIIPIALVVGAYSLHALRARKEREPDSIALSHLARLTKLDAYKRAHKRYIFLKRISIVAFAGMFLFLSLLVMRPVSVTNIEPETRNRDIMLCLDVSGSMTNVDATIVALFKGLTSEMKGERIGMTIFDSSPATVFPLTDDYVFVKQELQTMEDGLKSGNYEALAGTGEADGSSLIGDGVASCVMGFDSLDTKRSRSIILATDNFLSGSPIVTLSEAAGLAKSKDIRIYGINPSGAYFTSEESVAYKKAVLSTQGSYYAADIDIVKPDVSKVRDIIKNIENQDATRFRGSPRRVEHDIPTVFVAGFAILAIVYTAVMWRMKE